MNAQDINSSYNSLQASLEKRISHGLTLLGSYTYSKSIDDLPVGGNVSEIASDQPSALPWDNPLRHQFDRGPSDFDRTHRFVASYVWQLPKLSGKSHLVRSALGEWSWSGLLTTQSGAPLTILSGLTDKNDPSGTGLGRARALFTGGDPYGASGCGTKVHCVDYINQNAFVQPPAGTFGNVGKGWLRWKGAVTWDMGLSKNFSFTERWRLQFRAEFFNVFNHVNLRDTSTDTTTMSKNSSTFGQLISANEPRIGQLALKLIF